MGFLNHPDIRRVPLLSAAHDAEIANERMDERFRRKIALFMQAFANMPLKLAGPILHNAAGHPFLQSG